MSAPATVAAAKFWPTVAASLTAMGWTPHGRMVLPLTAPMPLTSANIGKGLLVLLTGEGDGDFTARTLSFVAGDQERSVRVLDDVKLLDTDGQEVAGGHA